MRELGTEDERGAGVHDYNPLVWIGAEGRTRTDMVLPPVDFESTAYTNFATPAGSVQVAPGADAQ